MNERYMCLARIEKFFAPVAAECKPRLESKRGSERGEKLVYVRVGALQLLVGIRSGFIGFDIVFLFVGKLGVVSYVLDLRFAKLENLRQLVFRSGRPCG